MMIEQCECGGAICAHGSCTRCRYCKHCGPSGREYYEEQLADAIELGGSINEAEAVREEGWRNGQGR